VAMGFKGRETTGEERTVLVLPSNNQPAYPIVLIAPVTSDKREKGQWDFELRRGEAGLESDCVAAGNATIDYFDYGTAITINDPPC